MKFGPRDVGDAVGSILAHSVMAGDRRVRKGVKLSKADVADLQTANISQVTVAQLSATDVHEDAAARQLAAALVADQNRAHLRLSTAFTGRVNVYAERDGLFVVDAGAIARTNGIDPAITVATLADKVRVQKRALLATVKIIPFAAPQAALKKACATAQSALNLAPFALAEATLILTRTPGMPDKLLAKGRAAIEQRMHSLGVSLNVSDPVLHTTSDLATAITNAGSDLVLILTASATSDQNDVGPAALRAARGELIRFGMPVDPGNLLFLGRLGARTVVGLPGCARSPALNGADWVLERLVAGIGVTADDIAAMGVGGLLKEIPTRTQPRGADTATAKRPKIEVILLAAGASARMRGVDKLLQDIDGSPLLRRAASVALTCQADGVSVVLPPDNEQRQQALAGLEVNRVTATDWHSGMSASMRAGLNVASRDCDGVIFALADMPDVTPEHLNRLIAAFDPLQGHEICRAVTEGGAPGHPVLFGRRFFENLAALSGDQGAREIIRDAGEFLLDVVTPGQGASVDLDTPEDWARWREGRN